MITAIDTNILLDILVADPEFYEVSMRVLEESANKGSLVICDLVYAELCVHFGTRRDCDEFLDSAGIRVEALQPESHFLASRIWTKYLEQGGKQTRIMPDFLIGSHAKVQATRLLSRDRGFYRSLFPSLQLVDPAISH